MTVGYHQSVLLKEAISYLDVKPGKNYIDATLGGGGHSLAIKQMGGEVLGIDQDPEALEYVQKTHPELTLLRQGSFEKIAQFAREVGFEKVAGVLFDLGVSSHQLEAGYRGFSFREDAPLDMRMNPDMGVTAADLLNALSERELEGIFKNYGEEMFARKIANRIVASRLNNKIETTKKLAELIEHTVGFNPKARIHPATRVFQALRIAVNDELNSLNTALPEAVELLDSGGRLVVISFHSLEDRIVKNYFKREEDANVLEILTKKPLEPTEREVRENPRARSAKLRAAMKKSDGKL